MVANAGDLQVLQQTLPDRIDSIVELLGCPDKDRAKLETFNRAPAEATQGIAEQRSAKVMGYIGGTLGPKSFTNIKKEIIDYLKQSSVPLAVVSPAFIAGEQRTDAMAKLTPPLTIPGKVSKNFLPTPVEEVATQL